MSDVEFIQFLEDYCGNYDFAVEILETPLTHREFMERTDKTTFENDVVREVAIDEGFPHDINIDELGYHVEIKDEIDAETWLYHLIDEKEPDLSDYPDINVNDEDRVHEVQTRMNTLLTPEVILQFKYEKINIYSQMFIEILDDLDEFLDAQPWYDLERTAKRMAEQYDENELINYIREQGTSEDYFIHKIDEAMSDINLLPEYVDDKESLNYEIVDIHLERDFEELADEFSYNMEGNLEHYMEWKFFEDIHARNHIYYKINILDDPEDFYAEFEDE